MGKFSNNMGYSISVIIPTYKPANYFYDCLDSLVNQKLSHDNFEVIVVLNGEKLPFIYDIDDYNTHHPEINLRFFYSEHKGVSAARNLGLKEAKGKGIVFIDDDDLISPNYLEQLLTNFDGELMVIANMKTFKEDINQLGNDYLSIAYEKCRLKRKCTVFDTTSFYSNVCGKLLPQKSIGNTRFNTKMEVGEDSVFIVEVAKNIHGIMYTNTDAIYYRRIRNNSVSRKKRTILENFKITATMIGKFLSCIQWSLNKNNICFISLKIGGALKDFLLNVMREVR